MLRGYSYVRSTYTILGVEAIRGPTLLSWAVNDGRVASSV